MFAFVLLLDALTSTLQKFLLVRSTFTLSIQLTMTIKNNLSFFIVVFVLLLYIKHRVYTSFASLNRHSHSWLLRLFPIFKDMNVCLGTCCLLQICSQDVPGDMAYGSPSKQSSMPILGLTALPRGPPVTVLSDESHFAKKKRKEKKWEQKTYPRSDTGWMRMFKEHHHFVIVEL